MEEHVITCCICVINCGNPTMKNGFSQDLNKNISFPARLKHGLNTIMSSNGTFAYCQLPDVSTLKLFIPHIHCVQMLPCLFGSL